MRRLTALLLVLVAGAVTVVSGRSLERLSAERPTEASLLYLPNGQHLKLASLGQAPVLADLIYLWAIQYYSVYEREDRFRYVEHVFGNVIAEPTIFAAVPASAAKPAPTHKGRVTGSAQKFSFDGLT